MAGTASLAGVLDLSPIGSYVDPAQGIADDFVLITAQTRSGVFAEVHYDGSPLAASFGPDADGSFRSHQGNGLFRNVRYTPTTVEFQNLNALQGDTDGDKDVDITDFNTLAGNFGDSPVEWTDADFDADNDVDITDFNALAANFGPYGAGPGQVPELSTLVLFTLGIFGTTGVVCWRRRQ